MVLFGAMTGSAVLAGPAQSGPDVVIGKTIILHSKLRGEDRQLFVRTPEGYDRSRDRFPVLFVLDGRDYFDAAVAIVQYRAACGQFPEMIVIGVSNTDRGRDMTPSRSALDAEGNPAPRFLNSGGADDFLRFFKSELIPYVDENYRTRPFRIIAAHSLSALFVIHAFLTEPDVFGAYIAISPSLWWDGKILLRRAEERLPGLQAAGRFFFFSVGGLESEMMSGNVQHLFRLFFEYAPAGLAWKLDRLENESHGSQALRALDDGLAFIYAGWEVPLRTIGLGLAAVGSHFGGLREAYGYDIEPSADDLEIYGLTALELKRPGSAVAFFSAAVKLRPSEARGYDLLGQAQEAAGLLKEAMASYELACRKAAADDSALPEYKNHLENVQKKLPGK